MVNSITGGAVDAYSAYSAVSSAVGAKKPEDTKTAASKASQNAAATFERTTTDEEIAAKEAGQDVSKESEKKIYKPDTELVQKLKSDAEQRAAQMQSLVETLLSGQAGQAAKSIFDVLGEKFSPEEIAQAKEDVSEDGYYGVKQTSQRILDFATALTGGDPDKIEEMREAFKKGFEQAKEAFGGELPEISQQTYDAVMKGFDDMKSKTEEAEA